MTSTIDGTAVTDIRDICAATQEPKITKIKTPDGLEFSICTRSNGANGVAVIDLEGEANKWRETPLRRKGDATAHTLEGFIDLVKRHADADSVVFADIISAAPKLTAVIDYNMKDHQPRFGDHRVCYSFPISPEWQAWKAADGKAMTQGDFAQWVEDHIAELASPYDAERSEFEPLVQTNFAAPNEIVRLARGLQINVESKVVDIRTLQSGEAQIQFEEAHKDSDGKPLKIAGLFMLSIPLFVGGAVVRVPARLRYRKVGQGLAWSYHLYRWQEAFRAALVGDLVNVSEDTGLPVYEGSPEQ